MIVSERQHSKPGLPYSPSYSGELNFYASSEYLNRAMSYNDINMARPYGAKSAWSQDKSKNKRQPLVSLDQNKNVIKSMEKSDRKPVTECPSKEITVTETTESETPRRRRRTWQGISHKKSSIAIYRDKLTKQLSQEELKVLEAANKFRRNHSNNVSPSSSLSSSDVPSTPGWRNRFSKLRKFASNIDIRPKRWRSVPNIKSSGIAKDDVFKLDRPLSNPPSLYGSDLRGYDPLKELGVKKRKQAGQGRGRPNSVLVESCTESVNKVERKERPVSLDLELFLASSSLEDTHQDEMSKGRPSASSRNIFKLMKPKKRLNNIDEHRVHEETDGPAECHIDYSTSPPVFWFPPPPVASPEEERLI